MGSAVVCYGLAFLPLLQSSELQKEVGEKLTVLWGNSLDVLGNEGFGSSFHWDI